MKVLFADNKEVFGSIQEDTYRQFFIIKVVNYKLKYSMHLVRRRSLLPLRNAPVSMPDERKKHCYSLTDWEKFDNTVNDNLIINDEPTDGNGNELIDKLARNLTQALKTGIEKSIPIKRRRPI
jgi:hypothetical protein